MLRHGAVHGAAHVGRVAPVQAKSAPHVEQVAAAHVRAPTAPKSHEIIVARRRRGSSCRRPDRAREAAERCCDTGSRVLSNLSMVRRRTATPELARRAGLPTSAHI